MTRESGKRTTGGGDTTVARLLRICGRVTLWGAVAFLLGRGLVTTLAPAEDQTARVEGDRPDEAIAATAERFARLYLEDPSSKALRPFLAAGARIGAGRSSSARDVEVAQTAVVRSAEVGDGRVIVTVSCELRDSRTLYLAVPIVRLGPGEAAALGAPAIVAVPATVGAAAEQPRPLTGPAAKAIGDLVSRFLPAYFTAVSSSELGFLMTPEARIIPLGGAVELDSIDTVRQLGEGTGPRREVLASVQASELAGEATFPLTYRLRVVKRPGGWFVAAVEGAIA